MADNDKIGGEGMQLKISKIRKVLNRWYVCLDSAEISYYN